MLKIDRQFGLYVIREQLAASDTKACCIAEDPFFDRDVVLKLVTPATVGCLANLRRLDSHLQALSGLEHPSIAPLYDNGIENDVCYYTTPLYAGGNLTDKLTQPMNIGKSMRIILQLSSGLAYAYSEGFEHGKLSLKNIFFTKDAHAVITNFGISAAIDKLHRNGEKDTPFTPQGLRVETLQSIGEILVKLLLGTGAKPDAVSTAIIRQSHSAPIFRLVTDLLGLSENEISSFDELIERLTDLAVLGSEVGINEYVEYVERIQNPTSEVNIPGLKPAVTPSQRQLEIKEAVYAKNEIRRLVAEKTKLEEILQRATSYKKHAEAKLAAGAAALKAAQKTAVDATNELKIRNFHKKGDQWHPAVWVASGILVGSLLTGGYNHFYLSTSQVQIDTQSTQLLLPEESVFAALPQVVPTPPVLKTGEDASLPSEAFITNPSANKEEQILANRTPGQEEPRLWWPVGGEFDSSSAIPIALTSDQLLPNALNSQTTDNNFTFPTTANASAMLSTGSVIQGESKNWWPAGNEFSPYNDSETTQELHDSNSQEILSVVQNWAVAWSNQDHESYFAYYSHEYRPEQGQTQEEWRSMRLSRLTRPQWIKVRLQDFQLRSFGTDRVQVKLKQSYSSNHYQDYISKSLNLVKENGQWRILMERSLGDVNDIVGG